jgi:hypothetical protein
MNTMGAFRAQGYCMGLPGDLRLALLVLRGDVGLVSPNSSERAFD